MLNSTRNLFLKRKIQFLLDRLPEIESTNLTGETSFYGANWQIAKLLQMRQPLPSNVSWLHGVPVTMNPDADLEDLRRSSSKESLRLVYTIEQAEFLRKFGYPAYAVGAPFLYAQTPTIERTPGSVLIMPAHSTGIGKVNAYAVDEFEYLSKKFSMTVSCISGMCVNFGVWMDIFEKLKIPWITGAWVFDKNALTRIKIILKSFEYMATNIMGSHIFYALHSGCKIILMDEMHLTDEKSYDVEPYYQANPDMAKIRLDDQKDPMKSLKKCFPFLTDKDEDKDKEQQAQWATFHLGEKNKKNASEVACLLGWEPTEVLNKRYYLFPRSSHDNDVIKNEAHELNKIDRAIINYDESEAASLAKKLIDDTWILISKKDYDNALKLASDIKSLRIIIKTTDLARGLSFLGRGQKSEAYEAFREELRLFPDNASAKQEISKLAPKVGDHFQARSEFDQLIWHIRDYTMLSVPCLKSIYELTRKICLQNIPGHFVDCGVTSGGSSALIAYVIKRYSKRQRQVFCFDTFEGMPDPGEKDMTVDGISAHATGRGAGTCWSSEDFLLEICGKLGVGPIVRPVKGLFADTLPRWRKIIGPTSFLHSDTAWYTSTQDVMVNFYDQLIKQSSVQISDYRKWKGCNQAIHDFESYRGLNFNFTSIDDNGVWFTKNE
jgi:tetratricopeptide (TPR) repeat protein